MLMIDSKALKFFEAALHKQTNVVVVSLNSYRSLPVTTHSFDNNDIQSALSAKFFTLMKKIKK